MPRGTQHGNSSIEGALAELYGGIRERIILFSAETGFSASWVAERLSSLLSPERERVLHHLSLMRGETPTGNRSVEPLALAIDAHQHETQSTNVGPTSEAAHHAKVKKGGSAIKEYWAKMTPQEKAKVMADKLRVTAKRRELLPVEKARLKTLTAVVKGTATHKTNAVYAARSRARKHGLPLPPLPKESTAA